MTGLRKYCNSKHASGMTSTVFFFFIYFKNIYVYFIVYVEDLWLRLNVSCNSKIPLYNILLLPLILFFTGEWLENPTMNSIIALLCFLCGWKFLIIISGHWIRLISNFWLNISPSLNHKKKGQPTLGKRNIKFFPSVIIVFKVVRTLIFQKRKEKSIRSLEPIRSCINH